MTLSADKLMIFLAESSHIYNYIFKDHCMETFTPECGKTSSCFWTIYCRVKCYPSSRQFIVWQNIILLLDDSLQGKVLNPSSRQFIVWQNITPLPGSLLCGKISPLFQTVYCVIKYHPTSRLGKISLLCQLMVMPVLSVTVWISAVIAVDFHIVHL